MSNTLRYNFDYKEEVGCLLSLVVTIAIYADFS